MYADAWRAAPGAYPLSLSMPLAAAEHPHAAIDPFLWGLLPDNELVVARWAQRFHVSPRNAFALISLGERTAPAPSKKFFDDSEAEREAEIQPGCMHPDRR